MLAILACRFMTCLTEIVCAQCVPLLIEATAFCTPDLLAGFSLRDSSEFDDW
jgi:hypothetical protein